MFKKIGTVYKGYKIFSAFWDRWPAAKEKGMRKFWQTLALSVLGAVIVTICNQFGVSEEMQKTILDWLSTALLGFLGTNLAEHVTDTVKAKVAAKNGATV